VFDITGKYLPCNHSLGGSIIIIIIIIIIDLLNQSSPRVAAILHRLPVPFWQHDIVEKFSDGQSKILQAVAVCGFADNDAAVACIAALCLVPATVRRFDCTFDEDDYCGYSDESIGPVKWIRSKAHQHTSPGMFRPTCRVAGKPCRVTGKPRSTCRVADQTRYNYNYINPQKRLL